MPRIRNAVLSFWSAYNNVYFSFFTELKKTQNDYVLRTATVTEMPVGRGHAAQRSPNQRNKENWLRSIEMIIRFGNVNSDMYTIYGGRNNKEKTYG